MTLASGSRLGPYEILDPIGAGGMDEVYRARDERLKREAAIKVLPAFFSADTDRLRRFEHRWPFSNRRKDWIAEGTLPTDERFSAPMPSSLAAFQSVMA